jgi:PTH1 family peptidyl-tRNA hydrolase
VEAASAHLSDVLRPGDLVLLKGSEFADNLSRLCTVEVKGPASLPFRKASGDRQAAQPGGGRPERDTTPVRIVVGLGNPGAKYEDTPHNVGQRALDRLARSLGVDRWERREKALIADCHREGVRLRLIKPLVYVNNTGSVLIELAREIGFGPGECVLVQDDIDLPLGTTRMRMRGSDGGHKGMRSVLQAFGTDSVPRVKIGVGRPGQGGGAAAHVLRSFSTEELAVIEAAYAEAADKVQELVAKAARPHFRPEPGRKAEAA